MDSLGLECVKNLDPDRLEQLLNSRKVEACGGGPAVAVLRAAISRGADRVDILKYGDSGDISGDKSAVVGYLAAAIYRAIDQTETSAGEDEDKLWPTASDRALLLQIARQSIAAHLGGRAVPGFEVTPELDKPGAAFVTLNKHGRLRGCIGHTVAIQPLSTTVSECAIAAAVRDHRFLPVSRKELDELEIEISVLTPLKRVTSLENIVVGRDGLMIELGQQRGLLLPQVATEYGWSRQEFLEQTCRKAGLPGNAYQSSEAIIYSFQAEVFSE
jgi:AmmeMemoRadiSam system protein A